MTKTKATPKPPKAKKTAAKEDTKDPVLLFRRAMQSAANKNAKDLKAHPLTMEAPKGTNGAITTGVLCVDLITGGGFPKNRMTTVSGESGAGKTTLIQSSMGPELAKGVTVHYEDFEGAADHGWMLKNGTDINKYLGDAKNPRQLYYIPDFTSGEDGFRYMSRNMDEAIKLFEKNPDLKLPFHSGLYYTDSLAAMVPEELLENDEMGSKPVLAALLSSKIPLVRSKLVKSHSAWIAVNQLRENPRARFGNPMYEPGGNAPTFYADMKLWMTCVTKPKTVALDDAHPIIPDDTKFFKAGGLNLEQNADGSIDQYRYTHIKTVKNRVFSPLKETYMRIWIADANGQGQGIDPVFDTLRFYEEIGLCQFNSKDDVVLKGITYDYFDLKAEILTNTDLREEAYALLNSGKAFEMYFDRIGGKQIELPKPDAEIGDAPTPKDI